MMRSWKILVGDVRVQLRALPSESVQSCVTSPPYWGLRDYGVKNQLGRESTPDQYVAALVDIFREVHRVIKPSGTLWLNLGDCYLNAKGQSGGVDPKQPARRHGIRPNDVSIPGLKRKDLIGIPWMVAFAMRADGWFLRSDIIWSKPNAMPESVKDRPTRSHEYIFLFSKSRRYYYDHKAIKESLADPARADRARSVGYDPPGQHPHKGLSAKAAKRTDKQRGHGRRHAGFNDRWDAMPREVQQAAGANKRSVWTVATSRYRGAHFATYPEKLIEPCILAGSKVGDTIMDPFAGSGTTGAAALRLGRDVVLCELNPRYAAMARERIEAAICPLFVKEEIA